MLVSSGSFSIAAAAGGRRVPEVVVERGECQALQVEAPDAGADVRLAVDQHGADAPLRIDGVNVAVVRGGKQDAPNSVRFRR